MHCLVEHNAFTPHKSKITNLEGVTTIREALRAQYPDFVEFDGPTLVMLNGEATLRKQWDDPLPEDSHIQVMTLPGFGIDLIIFAAVAAVAAAAYALYSVKNIPQPSQAVERPKAKAAYTLEGEANTPKLGEPIEVVYGRNRWYPGYAAMPFRRYIDDQQYLYQLFCLGQGEFEIEKIMIEDTPIQQFQEVIYEVYKPGTAASLFPDSVITSVETQGLELFGPNENLFKVYGPFVINPPATRTNEIEVDVIMPEGLYYMKDDGGLDYRSIDVKFEIQAIDDQGVPQGGWTVLTTQHYEYRTTDPIRRTIRVSVPMSRYQIRGQRTNNTDTSYRAGNKIIWDATKAIIPTTREYGNITLLAVQMRASNNLSSESSNRINVVATRKVPKLIRGKWVPTTSRSLVWAAIDVLCSKYGGKVALDYVDINGLMDLDTELEAKGIYFDYIFTQRTKVWEALKLIFQVARAEPIIILPLVSAFRFGRRSVPVAVFTPDNIIKNSFEWLINYPDPLEPDGVEVTYVDQRYWKEDVVSCIHPDYPGSNLKKVTLYGCADRNRAFHEGMNMILRKKEIRETVKFQTGMEGFIPMRGDLIVVTYPIPKWGQYGHVINIADDKRTIRFNKGLDWKAGQNFIMLRLDNGSGFGPVPINPGASFDVGVLATALPDLRISSKVGREPVYFMFGLAEQLNKRLIVETVEPNTNDEVTITCTNYVPDLDRYDSVEAPAGTGGVLPPAVPDLPEVTFLNVSRIPGDYTKVRAVWGFAIGARYYLVQISYNNGATWKTLPTTTDTQMDIILEKVGVIHVRVAGVNVGAGPYLTWSGNMGEATHPPLDVTGLALSFPWNGKQLALQWNGALDAVSHIVEVYNKADDKVLKSFEMPGTAWTMNHEDAAKWGIVSPEYVIRVYGQNSKGWSPNAATMRVINPPVSKVGGFAYTILNVTTTLLSVRLSWAAVPDSDLLTYKVWTGTTPDFVPSDSNLIIATSSAMVEVTMSKPQAASNVYVKIAGTDVWGNAPVYSDAFPVTIPA